VAVTAGYIHREPAMAEFYAGMDAANVDLKAFYATIFMSNIAPASLQPILDTLRLSQASIRIPGSSSPPC
jgi:pyruvate formate lyase activating enzyme